MEITFLGTSCMVPTKDRNVPAIYMEHKGEGILLDCGEGTQRQMNIAGINRNKVRKVLITHWHGDHVSGLVGLIQTIGNAVDEGGIIVYGPRGTRKHMDCLLCSCVFDVKLNLKVVELNPKGVEEFYSNQDYVLSAAEMDHSTPCVGYSLRFKDQRKINLDKAKNLGLREGPVIGKLKDGRKVTVKGREILPDDISTLVKGKKVTFIFDTSPNKNCIDLAEDSDLLICESSFTSDLQEKAQEFKHVTTQDAALIANQANVKKLIITHFSQRYKTDEKLKKEIQTMFANSETAHDFMKTKL
ncbi:ribonuclease Z [Candidatus Woesearchaeota archaeon]|nr:ribonuclease Z [Candidatus Woesearchaeota archaeon]